MTVDDTDNIPHNDDASEALEPASLMDAAAEDERPELEVDAHSAELLPLKDAPSRVRSMYRDYFLEYASYVILERAVPALEDGLKPVQRRLFHALREMEDGRFHKVANVIGQTMKFHPHGDASIGDALVQLGQKNVMVETQGNWGNILTGDNAAAPRYIEARLSKFALEVAFNPKITEWQSSYDGRAKEPVHLPLKFPLLLAQGVEGIAVGLSTKVLPHNFLELIDASIALLQNKPFELFPDFPTGGIADISNYNDGERGGRVRVRARITSPDKKSLVITEIPFGTTTASLMESIVKANEKGKIKVRKIEDNTAEHVEIVVHLAPNISPDKTIDALYAFTACESSISPLCCVIEGDRPIFVGVRELLKRSTQHTLELLRMELEVQLHEQQEHWHFASLERIFIENRIYRDIEECETWEAVLAAIDSGLKPHIGHLVRAVTQEDLVRLTEIRIKRISKFDADKANDHIAALEGRMVEIKHHLEHLVTYAVNYFKELRKKYGAGRERKTELRLFDAVVASKVAIANEKLYVNRAEGFVGIGLKKDEYVCDCSDLDDVVVIRQDGTLLVTKVDQKTYVGNDILYVNVFKKGDQRTVYNAIYRDGTKGASFVKRFNVTGTTRDREYPVTQGTKGSELLYLSANPNGEAEVVTVHLKPLAALKKLRFDLDFASLAVRGRSSRGNTVTKYQIKKVELKEKGASTLAARNIWLDETVRRLNDEGRGRLLGAFRGDDKILTVASNGIFRLTSYDLSTHFDEEVVHWEKWRPEAPITVIYWDASKEAHFIKRLVMESDSDLRVVLISEAPGSTLTAFSTHPTPQLTLSFKKVKDKSREDEVLEAAEFIAVKGWKAQGNKLSAWPIKAVAVFEPELPELEVVEPEAEQEVDVVAVPAILPEDGASEASIPLETPSIPSNLPAVDLDVDDDTGDPGVQITLDF
jgi:topoisomerase-4 subunit A